MFTAIVGALGMVTNYTAGAVKKAQTGESQHQQQIEQNQKELSQSLHEQQAAKEQAEQLKGGIMILTILIIILIFASTKTKNNAK